MAQEVGRITNRVITALNLNIAPNTPILLGQTNIEHMLNRHYNDYVQYSPYISNILQSPDYIALNPRDSSIEYVKEFVVNQEYVKIAVRVSNNGKYFARSIYRLNNIQ